MTVDDIAQVHSLLQAAFVHSWTSGMIRMELEHPWSRTLLAVGLEGQILGVAFFWMLVGELQILNLASDPKFRRQGVARFLMQAALKAARENGCENAFLEVRTSNVAAIQLYASLGFQDAGLRPKYYADTGEDALLMQLQL